MHPLLRRFLIAARFSFLIIAGVLLYTAYKSHTGLSPLNLLKFLAAGGCIALAVKSFRLART